MGPVTTSTSAKQRGGDPWHDPDRAHHLRWPMAYAIMGGLAVATLLTLMFLPALHVT